MRQRTDLPGVSGLFDIAVVAILNVALQLVLVYGVVWVFDAFFHTPWSRR